MKPDLSPVDSTFARIVSRFALAALLAHPAAAQAGSWTALAHQPPGPVNLLLLLSDGTVMAAKNTASLVGNSWYRLSPDAHGSYIQGSWSVLASSHYERLAYPSQVLRDGRVFVAGGEYGSGGHRAEVYDPQTNLWTEVTPPPALWNVTSDNFYDCNSELTPDGRVLLMPVFPHTPGIPLLYDPAANSWSNAGQLFRGVWQDEASWVKLRDESLLTVDPWGTFSERYLPASDTWVDDGIVPVALYSPYGFELGAGLLLPSGQAFFLGGTGHTALYTPSGTASPGVWSAGPDIPGNHATPDAPAAMLCNGRVLCAVSPMPTPSDHYPSPTSFYEYDPLSNSFASVGAPLGASEPGSSYGTMLLDLPDGTVLFSHFGPQLFVYTPAGAPLAAGKPAITNLTRNTDGSFHLEGTGLTGISAGASYGDDYQMNSNYPLVRLSDGAGLVRYARTYDWSTTSVQTGSALLSTEFRVPDTLPSGNYMLEVVANGIASDPLNFPWSADFEAGCFGDGSSMPCPCTNPGSAGRGCDNSAQTGGAELTGSGLPSLAADSLQLASSGELPTALSIVFQGTLLLPAHIFGAGLRCVGGNLKRLYAANASGGTLLVPPAGALAISTRSASLGDTIQSGEWRCYQIYYRDPNFDVCGLGFDVTPALSVRWRP